MKRLYILFLAAVCGIVNAVAVNYCASTPWGYGASATGGGNASPTLVKNESELKTALKSNNKVIVITQDITVENQISTDKSNLTITALPGKKLISTGQTKSVSGILYLKGSNIILRNLTFEGPGAYDCDGKDNLTLTGAQNVWVDHCDFQDGCDGNFDINGYADNITVTWCRFRYLKAPKAGGSGGSDDHRYSNLLGSSEYDKPADGTYNITYGYCWWDEGCRERMVRCRNCELHFLNCYWNSSVSNCYVGPQNAKCYFEGCTFAGKANSAKNIFKSYGGTNACIFVNCIGNLPSNSGSVAAPTYSYDQLSAAEAKALVINACGAGATLTVTEQAVVSSACDNGETPVDPPVDPDPAGPISGDCCVNLGLGTEPTATNSGIPSEFGKLSVTYSLNHTSSLWYPGYLNLGSNNDYITFDFSAYETTITTVEFDVTIPNWNEAEGKNTIAYHWNNGTNTEYTIASAATENVKLTAPANATSFTIQRTAKTGTRLSQVCFRLDGSGSEDIESIQDSGVETQKIIREGQLLILRENKTYTMYGVRVD